MNVQGLNSPQKHTKVFRYLRSHRIYIACLQEIHFDTPYLQVNHATKQRGILIAFHNRVPFTCDRSIADPQGRYLLHKGTLTDLEVTIRCYYVSNECQLPFLSHLFNLKLCGDSYMVLNPNVDCSVPDAGGVDSPSRAYRNLLDTLG